MNFTDRVISFKSIYDIDKPLKWWSYLIIAISVLSLVSLALISELYLFILPALITLPLIFLVFIRPRVWLAIIILSFGFFIHSADEGLSILDVINAVLYLGSISLWFVWKVFVNRKKIVLNWGDWAILAFYGLLLFNFFIAISNDVEPELWLREYLMTSIILLYFPIRESLKTEKDVKFFLLLFGFVIVIAGFFQLYLYYTKVQTNVVYAYELKSSISINQALFTVSSIFAFILAFSQPNKLKEIFVIILTSLYVVFLISTFSRTFWLMLGLSILLMFFFLPLRKKIIFLSYVGFLSLMLFIAAFLFMRDQADLILGVAFSRLESTSAGKKDPSLIARFREWERLEYLIKQQPLGGNGLNKTFTFHFPLNTRARHTTTIHNGYLWLMYRTGIPMTLLYLFFTLVYTIKSGKLISRTRSPILRAVVIACFSTLLSMYIFNLTSAQFFTRDGIIVMAFTMALIGVVQRINQEEKLALT